MIIYLDIDPLIGLQIAKKVGSPDRIEQAGLEFFERTRTTFKSLVESCDYAVEIDASLSLDEVEMQIHQVLIDTLNL